MQEKRLLKGISRLVLNLAIAVLFVYLLLIFGFDNDFKIQNIIDAIFAVGFIFISVGIITFSNAGQVFDGMRFVLKQWFSKTTYTHLAFYDYKQQRQAKRQPATGIYALVIGIIFVATSAIYGYINF